MSGKRPRQSNIDLHKLNLARDIAATVARVQREGEATLEEVVDDLDANDVVTTFLDSVELDDRNADQLWTALPPDEITEVELVAAAEYVVATVDESDVKLAISAAAARSVKHDRKSSTSVGRKLRAPRHPFE